jgi:hypothetical protein
MGISEQALLLALAMRAGCFAAMGCLPKVLSAATQWAFLIRSAHALAEEDACQQFADAIDFAGCLLDAYR